MASRRSGDTLTIRLTRAAGDLPVRLASSFFCPVPVGTPAVPGGGTSTPIPMAGPYRVASASGGQVVLERNPNYRATGLAGSRASSTRRSQAGGRDRARRAGARRLCDGTTISYDPAGPLVPGGALDTRYGLASRAGRAGNARYLPSAEPGIDGMAFNTQRPLFRDVRMRRAAAYALDRRALAAVFGEQPTDRLIPPAVGGPGGNIAYPDEPDLATARRLAGQGAIRKATLYFCGDPVNKRIAEIVRANLAEIRINVRIDHSLGCLTGPETKRLAAADIQLTSRFDIPDPAPFVEMALGNSYSCPDTGATPACGEQIERARGTRGAERVKTYARLDAKLVRDAVPVAVYASAVNPEFFSARVGCKVSQDALNFVDLGALCLRD